MPPEYTKVITKYIDENLLRKYIEHVGQCEGHDYISNCNNDYYSNVPFTDGEIAILERLSDEDII